MARSNKRLLVSLCLSIPVSLSLGFHVGSSSPAAAHSRVRSSYHNNHKLGYANNYVHNRQQKKKRQRTTECQAALALIDGSDGGGGAASAIDTFFQTQPYLSAFLTCSFKASAADVFAQKKQSKEEDDNIVVESTITTTDDYSVVQKSQAIGSSSNDGSSSIDLSRNIAFIVYGGLYQGLFQEFIYSEVFPRMFTEQTAMTVAMQVGIDMLLIGPFICLPLAYVFKALFIRDEEQEQQGNLLSQLQGGMDKYVEDITERNLLFTFWALWGPVKTLTFTVIPMHYRIAFIALVSFFWMFILSTVSSSTSSTSSDSTATTTSATTATATTTAAARAYQSQQ